MPIIVCNYSVPSDLAKVEQAVAEGLDCLTYGELQKKIPAKFGAVLYDACGKLVDKETLEVDGTHAANFRTFNQLQTLIRGISPEQRIDDETKEILTKLIQEDFYYNIPSISEINHLCEEYEAGLEKLKRSWGEAYKKYASHKTLPSLMAIRTAIKQLITLSGEIAEQVKLLLKLPDESTCLVMKERLQQYQEVQKLTPKEFFLQHVAVITNAKTTSEIALASSTYFALHENSFTENAKLLLALWNRHWELQCELYTQAQLKVRAEAITNSWSMTGIDLCLFYMCAFSGNLSATSYGMTRFLLQATANLWTRATTKIQLPNETACLKELGIQLLAANLLTESPSLDAAITALNHKNTELKRKIDFFRISANWSGIGKGMVDWLAPTPASSTVLQTLSFFSIRKWTGSLVGKAGDLCLQLSTQAFTAPDKVKAINN